MENAEEKHIGSLLVVLAVGDTSFDESELWLQPINITSREGFLQSMGEVFDICNGEDGRTANFQARFLSGLKYLGEVSTNEVAKKKVTKRK